MRIGAGDGEYAGNRAVLRGIGGFSDRQLAEIERAGTIDHDFSADSVDADRAERLSFPGGKLTDGTGEIETDRTRHDAVGESDIDFFAG